MRRHFQLPAEDTEYLENCGLQWETVAENQDRRVVIYGSPVPAGYNVTTVDINLRIVNGYPDTQIDMAYFSPLLARSDGKAIGAVVNYNFDGKVWQQWSRHRTGTNPWRPGLDNIESHLLLVEEWLKRELGKG
ncbi:MAG: hypothetical protein HGB32_11400 [Geobacteraceae bacterium]|nr:hypothetical protein [Geobacteraceae bacterium]NTW80734.1 hypothetical protein [Geobacteraceae bacterium]